MIPYHGTPLGGRRDEAPRFFRNRHALVSYLHPEDIGIGSCCCRSFCLDNGAFSAWKSGKPITDWSGYYDWVREWMHHPGFDFALIPDVIDGDEAANDNLISRWPWGSFIGVPVWHLHESLQRLKWLCSGWPRVALGSSGEWPDPDMDADSSWRARMDEAMEAICVDGRPMTKLHGLRMLNPEILEVFPLSSADSTNAAQNASRKAEQARCSVSAGRAIIAENIESVNAADRWHPRPKQAKLFVGAA